MGEALFLSLSPLGWEKTYAYFPSPLGEREFKEKFASGKEI